MPKSTRTFNHRQETKRSRLMAPASDNDNNNKVIIDYTSPALCTPVTPFPPLGDAAYRQRAGGGPSHKHTQHVQKLGKDRACGSGDILADRQTDMGQKLGVCPFGEGSWVPI